MRWAPTGAGACPECTDVHTNVHADTHTWTTASGQDGGTQLPAESAEKSLVFGGVLGHTPQLSLTWKNWGAR